MTDSAGVRITVSPAAARPYAEVHPDPVLSLGGPDVVGPALFSNIRGVHIDAAGNVWVADGASGEVRIFRPDGTVSKTLGGRGDGPGEFRRLRMLGVFAGDSMALWDDANARLTILDRDGALVRTLRIADGYDVAPQAHRVFADGTILGQQPRVLAAGALRAGQLLGDTTRLVRVDPARGTVAVQAVAPGPTWLWTGRGQVPVPFTINAGFDLRGEAVHIAAGSDFRIRVVEAGRLTAVYGVARPAREVTGADRAAYAALIERWLPAASQRSDHLAALDHPAVPEYLPGYSQVLVADDGNVWARIYSPDPTAAGTWDVYAPDGQWLGDAGTPAGFVPAAISRDRIVGVWFDELGVEHVRVHRFSTR